MLKDRKAQVTVFMIIGIILLFSTALMFYIRNEVAGGISDEFVPSIQEVPLEAQPIKVFVENCLKRTATAGIKQLGIHSGYIDPTDYELSEKAFLVGVFPTESDALSMPNSPNSLMPYWWYLESPNDCSGNCKLSSNRPGLREDTPGVSLEGQLDKYIERHIGACLDGFRSFREQGFEITENGPLVSEVTLADADVVLLLEYPLSVERQGETIDIDSFFTKVDVRLKDAYFLATEITNLQIEAFFLELHAMNLITQFSWPSDMSRIPPTGDFTWSLSDHRIWTRSETQDKIESLVLSKFDQLQVIGSDNFVNRLLVVRDEDEGYKLDTIGQGMVDMMRLQINDTTAAYGFEVDFTYLDWWPIYLNINDQEVLAPTSVEGSDILSWLGINNYAFWYDVSFPVMVTIRQPDAFAGEGFTFRFALEGNIRDNNHTSENYVKLSNDTGATLACKMNQRNSGNIDVNVLNALTGEPVEGAKVSFVLKDESCFVGFSELDSDGMAGVDAPFPVGLGALRVNHEDYLTQQNIYMTRVGEGDNVTVELMPFRYINASVFKKVVNYDIGVSDYVFPEGAAPSPIDPGHEDAMIVFTRVDNDTIGEFETQLIVSNSTSLTLLKLVPGTYEVQGFLFYENPMSPVRVPAETLTFEIPFSEDVTVELNETVLDPFSKGGMFMDNETGYLEIDQDTLFNSDRVVFYLISFPPPVTHVGDIKNAPSLEQLSLLKEYSGLYRSRIEPDWLE